MRIVENWEDSCVLPKDFKTFSDQEKWAVVVDLKDICWRCGTPGALHPIKESLQEFSGMRYTIEEITVCSTPRPFFRQMTLFDAVEVRSFPPRSLSAIYWDVDQLIMM